MAEHPLEDVHIGDTVLIHGDIEGYVVFNASARRWSREFPEAQWPKDEYDGLMIRTSSGALVFHHRSDFDDDYEIEVLTSNRDAPE